MILIIFGSVILFDDAFGDLCPSCLIRPSIQIYTKDVSTVRDVIIINGTIPVHLQNDEYVKDLVTMNIFDGNYNGLKNNDPYLSIETEPNDKNFYQFEYVLCDNSQISGNHIIIVSYFGRPSESVEFAFVQDVNLQSTNFCRSDFDGIIPSWVKNNAGWWADDQIDDISFLGGIQFLIEEGFIKVNIAEQDSISQDKEIPKWIKFNTRIMNF